MKRALWITFIAVALIALAAIGWIARRFDKPSRHEQLSPRRGERLVHAHEPDNRRRNRRAGWGSRPTAYAR